MNIKEKCRELNMPYMAVMKRISRGWSVEKSLQTPIRRKVRERIFYNGKPLSELFPEHIVSKIKERIKCGWSVEKAVETPCKTNKRTGLDRSKLSNSEYHKQYARMRKANVDKS